LSAKACCDFDGRKTDEGLEDRGNNHSVYNHSLVSIQQIDLDEGGPLIRSHLSQTMQNIGFIYKPSATLDVRNSPSSEATGQAAAIADEETKKVLQEEK
jgi:hypothetical protein